MTSPSRVGGSAPELAPPPALLLAASSHRSGSTLLQRYITAVSRTFVWGESGPFIESLWRAAEGWPSTKRNERDYREIMDDPSSIERRYTPNLAPPLDTLLDEMRRSVRAVYARMPDGYDAWGWKAVSYGAGEIDFVRRLFPQIRIVLLVRDPWDVARSIRRKGWIDRRGYYRDMADAAEHWMLRTRDFIAIADRDDAATMLLRYEDLHDRLDDLHAFLGLDVDPARSAQVLSRKLGTAPTLSRFRLTDEDMEAVTTVAGEVAGTLGYAPSAAANRS